MRELLQALFHFRNFNHELWFYLSMAGFALCLILYFWLKFKLQFFYGAVAHVPAMVLATIKVVILQRPSAGFSIDCVWFNGLMCAIYIVLFIFVSARKKKLEKAAADSA